MPHGNTLSTEAPPLNTAPNLQHTGLSPRILLSKPFFSLNVVLLIIYKYIRSYKVKILVGVDELERPPKVHHKDDKVTLSSGREMGYVWVNSE